VATSRRMAAMMCWYRAAIAVLDHPMIAITVRSGICNSNWSRTSAAGRGCAVRRCGLSGGERPSPLILSQQDGGAGGSLIRVVPGRVGAA
jgi:hypothetical protein